MPTLDEQIALSLHQSLRSGELQSAASWGKPLDFADDYAQTPEEFRLAFKMLKDAGLVPPEVETMKRMAALREVIEREPAAPQADAMRKRLSELQQQLALRLEKLRVRQPLNADVGASVKRTAAATSRVRTHAAWPAAPACAPGTVRDAAACVPGA